MSKQTLMDVNPDILRTDSRGLSRRGFMVGLVAGLTLLPSLTACGEPNIPQATPLPRPTDAPTPKPLYTQDQLLGLMLAAGAEVTDPILRALLEEKAFPIFRGASSVSISGVTVPVFAPYIAYSQQVSSGDVLFEGGTTPQQKDDELSKRGVGIPKYSTTTPHVIDVPFSGILTPEQRVQYEAGAPDGNKKQDKNGITELTYQFKIGGATRQIGVHMAPAITAATNPRFKQEHLEPVVKLILLKEAFSFAFCISMMESLTARMQELEIPTEIDALDSTTNQQIKIPLVLPAFRGLNNGNGRGAALPDVFGYLAMGKGVLTIPSYQGTYSDIGFNDLRDDASKIQFPQDNNGLIQTTLNWALNSKVVPTLAYIGDLNKIP